MMKDVSRALGILLVQLGDELRPRLAVMRQHCEDETRVHRKHGLPNTGGAAICFNTPKASRQ